MRGVYAVAALIPHHPWPRGSSTWLGKDDEPQKRTWEKAPRRARRPSCCSVLFRFCDPDLVCSQREEKTLGPRILKLKGGPGSQLLKRKGMVRTFTRLFCASWPGRLLPGEGRIQACARAGPEVREKALSRTRVSAGPSPCRGPHLPSWVRILLLQTLEDGLWLCWHKELWRPKSPGASPAQAALPSLLSCLEPRRGRDGSPEAARFGTFLAGRRWTGKLHLFFRNFHVWGLCPQVPELGKHVGSGVCMSWGAQRGPGGPAGQRGVPIHARLTREAEQR